MLGFYMSKSNLAAVFLIIFTADLVLAERREHHAHDHGRGQMRIALDKEHLSIAVELPGIDVVGFEHAPGSEHEHKKVEKALAYLKSEKLFSFIPDGACWLNGDIKIDPSLFSIVSIGPDSTENHKHESAPRHKVAHDRDVSHAGFRSEYSYTCKVVDGLRFGGFAEFPSLKVLAVELVMDDAQSKFELDPEKPTAYFRVKN
jgi:hypothetical protein